MEKRERMGSPIRSWAAGASKLNVAYYTPLGVSIVGRSDEILAHNEGKWLAGKVDLVFTSPPFPLNRKKAYDNKQGDEYREWLGAFAQLLRHVLTSRGSIVIELGNAWEPGQPVMSTLAIEALLEFKKRGELHLCQEFIWYNPAKLPSPAQWVTVDRVRVKDAFTRLWWMSPTAHPEADNRRVLQPYSQAMKALLASKKYNSGARPSEHHIGRASFLHDNGGSIPPNLLRVPFDGKGAPDSVLTGSNTASTDPYLAHCREHGIKPHPARMPSALADFFIKLCTKPGALVLDPFAGSNTTGASAERLGRRWVGIEVDSEYARAGHSRFSGTARSHKKSAVALPRLTRRG